MTLYAYDAAYEPDLKAVKTNGGIALARYFVGNYAAFQWKRVTTAQAAAIRAAGLGIIVNFEGGSDPIAGANARGMSLRDYGRWSAQEALTDIVACGVPQDGSIACYFSVDTGYDSSKFAALAEYFRGIHDIMDPARIQVKVYGDGAVIDFLVRTNLVYGKQWLAAPTSWPGFNDKDPNLCMVQLVGSPVSGTDQNEVLDPKAIGAWWPANSPYDPAAPGVLMALTDAEQTELLTDMRAVKAFIDAIPVDAGQTSAAAELGALLPTVQNIYNRLNQADGDVKGAQAALSAALTKLETDILAAISGAPAGGLTAAQAADSVVKEFAAKLAA